MQTGNNITRSHQSEKRKKKKKGQCTPWQELIYQTAGGCVPNLHRVRKIKVPAASTKLLYVEWDNFIIHNYFLQIRVEIIKQKVVL